MVTSNNVLIGLGVIVIAFFFLKKNGASVESIFRPVAQTSTGVQPVDPEITGLKQILAQAQSIFKNAFKAPILTKGLTTGGKTFPCRGPNCLGSFQAKGVRTSFDPFTGQRLIVGFTPRAATFLKKINPQAPFNVARITQGNIIKSDLMKIITNLTTQINILESKSV